MVETDAEDFSLATQRKYIPARMGRDHPIFSSDQEVLIFQRLEIIKASADRLEDQGIRQQFMLEEEQRALRYLLQDRAFLDEIPPPLTHQFDRCLQPCQTLTDVVVQFNRGLVFNAVKKFTGMMPIEDMVQEGNIGLLRAIDLFDYRRGLRFSTYATWWVYQSVLRGIYDSARTIRMPSHMEERLNLARRLKQQFEVVNSRLPTQDELYLLLENYPMLNQTKIDSIFATIASSVARPLISIQQPFAPDDDRTLEEKLADRGFVAVEAQAIDRVITKGLAEELSVAIRTGLGLRHAKMFELRYGLADGTPRTLQEIGDIYGLTRERVRQLLVECDEVLERTQGRQIDKEGRAALEKEREIFVPPQKSNIERILEVGKRWFDSAKLDQNQWARLNNRERIMGRLFFRSREEMALATKRLCLIFKYSEPELEQVLRSMVMKLMGLELS